MTRIGMLGIVKEMRKSWDLHDNLSLMNNCRFTVISWSVLRFVSARPDCQEAARHVWDPDGCSPNIELELSGRRLHRRPVAQSTDACRATVSVRPAQYKLVTSFLCVNVRLPAVNANAALD